MARVIQEHIKKPLADDVLFGRLKNGGHVRVVVDKDEDGQRQARLRVSRRSGDAEAGEAARAAQEPREAPLRAAQAAATGSERRHAAGRTRLGAEGAAEGVGQGRS